MATSLAVGIVENTSSTLTLELFAESFCKNVRRTGSDFHSKTTLSSKKAVAPTDWANAENRIKLSARIIRSLRDFRSELNSCYAFLESVLEIRVRFKIFVGQLRNMYINFSLA